VAATHDLVVMSDSDIRVDGHMLATIAAEFENPAVGMATCPYRAVPGPSVWSTLEAIGLNTEFIGGVLVARMLDGMKFEPIVMRGVTAKRSGLRFGSEVPDWLDPVRKRAAVFAEVSPEGLVQALVQKYPPGAPIGWHRDSASYGIVVGISLGADARIRFRRPGAQAELLLERRSAYVLAREARWQWEHHVPPVKELRYSITFRTARDNANA